MQDIQTLKAEAQGQLEQLAARFSMCQQQIQGLNQTSAELLGEITRLQGELRAYQKIQNPEPELPQEIQPEA